MPRLPSIDDVDGWTARLLKYQALEAAAERRGDRRAANRHVDKLVEALDNLELSGTEGPARLEALLSDTRPRIRGLAAGRVLDWKPALAIPVLARLMHEPLDPDSVSTERVGIRMEAEYDLAAHFGLPFADNRQLPDRLADLGIQLPAKTVQMLKK